MSHFYFFFITDKKYKCDIIIYIDYVYRYIYPTKHMIYIYRERDIIPTKIYHKKKSSGGESSRSIYIYIY